MPTSIVTYQDFREYMRFDAEYYHEKYYFRNSDVTVRYVYTDRM